MSAQEYPKIIDRYKFIKDIKRVCMDFEFNRSSYSSFDVYEPYWDLIKLLEEYNLAEADWIAMEKMRHRTVGNRYVYVKFQTKLIIELLDFANGNLSKFSRNVLLQLQEDIINDLDLPSLSYILNACNIQQTLFDPTDKYSVFYILCYLTSQDEIQLKRFGCVLREILRELSIKMGSSLYDKYKKIFEGDQKISHEDLKMIFDIVFKTENSGYVREITFVGKDSKVLIPEDIDFFYINGNIEFISKVTRGISSSIKKLIKISLDGRNIIFYKDDKDYLNRESCKIYMNGRYRPTEIITYDKEYRISSLIKIKAITRPSFNYIKSRSSSVKR